MIDRHVLVRRRPFAVRHVGALDDLDVLAQFLLEGDVAVAALALRDVALLAGRPEDVDVGGEVADQLLERHADDPLDVVDDVVVEAAVLVDRRRVGRFEEGADPDRAGGRLSPASRRA